MSNKLPQISGERMGRVLMKLGFILANQRGSHMKFIRPRGTSKEIIMVYEHHTIKKGKLSAILGQLELTVEEFKKLL